LHTNAIVELFSRQQRQRLSADQERKLIDLVLDHQGNPSVPWNSSWGDAIVSLNGKGLITPEQWARFMQRSLVVRLFPREKVRQNDPLPFQIIINHNVRGGSRFRVDADPQIISVAVDDQTLPKPPLSKPRYHPEIGYRASYGPT
ncbi:hypothetical protein GWI34_44435, partial [Actinomadura sp. DSM 109109]|nr:hypothetical protein [Actinomadura lepetitiana]